jgi:HEAT repeat protein
MGLILVPAVLGQLNEEELDELRDTIEFGINEEVSQAISRLKEADESALNEELLARFEGSFNPGLQTEIIDFFNEVAYQEAASTAVAIVSNFRGSDNGLVTSAVRLLRNPDVSLPEGAADALMAAADKGSGSVARQAIRSLGEREIAQAEELLLEKVQNRRTDQATREAAILALGEVGTEQSTTTLLSIAQDAQGGSLYRGYAIQSLGRIGAKEAEEPLRQLLSGKDAIVRSYATQALLELDLEDRQAILSGALRDSLAQTRVNALEWIREHDVEDMSRAVQYKVTNDPDPQVRRVAMKTLASLGAEEYGKVLEEIALDPSKPPEDRLSAMQTLVEERPARAVAAFQEPLREELSEGGDGANAIANPLARILSQTGSDQVRELYRILITQATGNARLYAIAGVERQNISGLDDTLKELRANSILHPAALQTIERLVGPAPSESEDPADDGDGDGNAE